MQPLNFITFSNVCINLKKAIKLVCWSRMYISLLLVAVHQGTRNQCPNTMIGFKGELHHFNILQKKNIVCNFGRYFLKIFSFSCFWMYLYRFLYIFLAMFEAVFYIQQYNKDDNIYYVQMNNLENPTANCTRQQRIKYLTDRL